MGAKSNIPRSRMLNLLGYLRRGDQLTIAIKAKCHPTTVSAVLNGRASQVSSLAVDIIAQARILAHRNNPYYNR